MSTLLLSVCSLNYHGKVDLGRLYSWSSLCQLGGSLSVLGRIKREHYFAFTHLYLAFNAEETGNVAVLKFVLLFSMLRRLDMWQS